VSAGLQSIDRAELAAVVGGLPSPNIEAGPAGGGARGGSGGGGSGSGGGGGGGSSGGGGGNPYALGGQMPSGGSFNSIEQYPGR